MTGEKKDIPINDVECAYIELFRIALSERSHCERLKAIQKVRYDVTANRLSDLFVSRDYVLVSDPKDYQFLKWVAETASVRHEAIVDLMEVGKRYQASNERKLNIAECIGVTVFNSIRYGNFKGVQVNGGILDQVRDEAKKENVYGGRDTDTLRKAWKTYRGVVHLGMAITYLEDNRDQHWHVLQLAELFREVLGKNCPKGTCKPYVSPSEQLKFLYLSNIKGPRFRDRGLPFFDG